MSCQSLLPCHPVRRIACCFPKLICLLLRLDLLTSSPTFPNSEPVPPRRSTRWHRRTGQARYLQNGTSRLKMFKIRQLSGEDSLGSSESRSPAMGSGHSKAQNGMGIRMGRFANHPGAKARAGVSGGSRGHTSQHAAHQEECQGKEDIHCTNMPLTYMHDHFPNRLSSCTWRACLRQHNSTATHLQVARS